MVMSGRERRDFFASPVSLATWCTQALEQPTTSPIS